MINKVLRKIFPLICNVMLQDFCIALGIVRIPVYLIYLIMWPPQLSFLENRRNKEKNF